ncbi:MAG: UDP-N-acetylmuramoyl-L-alanine--D-glutamate ligase [Chlorobiaceae bacterium]
MDAAGKRVLVIGAGRSGVAAAELLHRKGAEVLVTELGRIGQEEAARLRELGISFEQGGHSGRFFDADFAVVSPGIPPHAPVLQSLEAKGVAIYSEIELASWYCKARVVGVTGTDGKTTTSTLIHRIAEADGLRKGYRSFSVGNIGVPLASMVSEMAPGDVAVVELSSYQLERCFTFRPEVSVITNITPDHLDRYGGDIHRYAAAKYRIYANQEKGDTLIYNADDPMLKSHFEGAAGALPFSVIPFGQEQPASGEKDCRAVLIEADAVVVRTSAGSETVIELSRVLKESFRGRHNIYNTLAAVAAARALGIKDDSVRSALEEFSGVEHRQEFVASIDGSGWVNDSKATNLNAMRQALLSSPGRVVLIAGGRDKGNDYSSIRELVRQKVSTLIAIGESREKLASAFSGIVALKQADSLEEAVRFAREAAGEGESVLFSPGCASFDMFDDFEDRGRQFKQCVHQLQQC